MPCALDQVNHPFRSSAVSTTHGYYPAAGNTSFQTNIGHHSNSIHSLSQEYQLQSTSQSLHPSAVYHKQHLDHQSAYKGLSLLVLNFKAQKINAKEY